MEIDFAPLWGLALPQRGRAGTVDLLQLVLTGIEARGDVLRLNPELPWEIERLDM